MLSISNKLMPISRVLKTKAPVLAVVARQLTYVHPEQRLHQKLAEIHHLQGIPSSGISPLYDRHVPPSKDHPDYRLKFAKTLYDIQGPSPPTTRSNMTPDQIDLIAHNFLPPLHKNDATSSGAVVTNRLRAKTEEAMEKLLSQ